MYIGFLLGKPKYGSCSRLAGVTGISYDSAARFPATGIPDDGLLVGLKGFGNGNCSGTWLKDHTLLFMPVWLRGFLA